MANISLNEWVDSLKIAVEGCVNDVLVHSFRTNVSRAMVCWFRSMKSLKRRAICETGLCAILTSSSFAATSRFKYRMFKIEHLANSS